MQATRFLINAVVIKHAAAAAQQIMSHPQSYSAALLSTVRFSPERIKERPDEALVFPWEAKRGSHNGIKSVHGGALSSLADVFTRIHVCARRPQACVESVSFEISFLSVVHEDKRCNCVTHLARQEKGIVFTDFAFEDESSGEVYARGSHILAVSPRIGG
ncbi:hypothetical protein LSCM1_00727 [Leishmania martiniquensis]|uniref:Thioesterase domain-containing protein n=1 Tax=Leishmania martiniquensis TaxID=1580590 RepID=A0A836GCE5_9TRYP|nr:hypothetical protein LSCM1_00727 [Leishmania martiniquensis]